MQPRVLSILCIAMLPAGALAAPGDTADTPERNKADSSAREELQEPRRRTPPPGTVAADQQAAGQSGTAELIATDELIGRDVVTQEGERVGTLRFVTVSLDRGNISHLVIDTSGTDFESSQNAATGTPRQDPTAATSQQDPTTGQRSDTTAQAPGAPQEPGTPHQAPGTPQSPQTAQAPATTGQPGEQSQSNLLIVPWSVADLNTGDDSIVVAATGRHIASAPRLKREELNRLTEPALASYVIDYWAPASELAALEGRRNQQEEPARQPQQPQIEKNRQSEMPQSPDSPEGGSPDQAGAGALDTRPGQRDDTSSARPPGAAVAGTPGSAADSRTARDADLQDSRIAGASASGRGASDTGSTDSAAGASQSAAGASQSTAGASDRNAGAGGSGSNQIVLVGQEVVAAVTPPMFQLSKQLRGAKVIDRNGGEVGEIRQIVIDASTGDAAFAVIEGTSAGRAPVPLQALDWAAEGTTTLTADSSKLQSNEALTGQSGKVDRNELAELYQRFDAEPYWQASVRPGAQGTPQPPQSGPGALPQ